MNTNSSHSAEQQLENWINNGSLILGKDLEDLFKLIDSLCIQCHKSSEIDEMKLCRKCWNNLDLIK